MRVSSLFGKIFLELECVCACACVSRQDASRLDEQFSLSMCLPPIIFLYIPKC